MIDGEAYETLEYLLTSLNTHIRIAICQKLTVIST